MFPETSQLAGDFTTRELVFLPACVCVQWINSKSQIISPKLKNINNPNEYVLTVPISILFGNPILNRGGAERVKYIF